MDILVRNINKNGNPINMIYIFDLQFELFL